MNLILPNEHVSEKHVKSLTGSVHKSRNLERIDFQFDILTRPDKTTPPDKHTPGLWSCSLLARPVSQLNFYYPVHKNQEQRSYTRNDWKESGSLEKSRLDHLLIKGILAGCR